MAQQSAMRDAFKAYQGSDTLLGVLENFGLLKAHCLATGHVSTGPVWPALRRMCFHQANQLCDVLDRKASSNSAYVNRSCAGCRVVVVGAGPAGLCTAIESALLGADVVVLEKRSQVLRHNVLKLWPGVVEYFQSLGLKSFYRQFGVTGSDKIAIRRLQLVLVQIALLVGVRVEVGAEFQGITPPAEGTNSWIVEVAYEGRLSRLPCDCLVGTDGENSKVAQVAGFTRTTLQFSKAVGITFNFKHSRNRPEEVALKEFARSGFCYRSWFKEVAEETGLTLENFVYYKDETHYFVMAAKPSALLDSGILCKPAETQEKLLDRSNIDEDRFLSFTRKIAEKVGLPADVEYALNANGVPDMALFDFTKKVACSESTRIFAGEQPLLVRLAGDALMAPFWPTGTGANKAVLGALDTAHALCRFHASCSLPAVDREDVHRANLAEQLMAYYQLKAVASGAAEDLKPNAQTSRGQGAARVAGSTQYAWTLEPSSRYVKPEAERNVADAQDLYIRSFALRASM